MEFLRALAIVVAAVATAASAAVVVVPNGEDANHGRPANAPIYMINLNETHGFDFTLERHNVTDTGIEEFNSARLEKIRDSKKQQRIQSIQSEIMQRLGFANKPNVTFVVPDDTRERIAKKLEELRIEQEALTGEANEIYAERVQSFYPSCSLPRNTDREVWDDPSNFHIYYNISSPRQMQGTSINVSAAKLRLYKNVDESCTTTAATDTNRNGDLPNDQPWSQGTAANGRSSTAQQRLQVTVFQYLKPLRRNKKPRRKQLDTKTVPVDYEGWVEFNIQSSIRDWFENGNKNFGLEVILKDADQTVYNPSTFFQTMNCSESRANDPPFPRNLFEDDPTVGNNESSLFDNETYPTLDLRTVEFQEQQAISDANVSDHRQKRDVADVCEPETGCCLKRKYTNFTVTGRVVAPEGAWTNTCQGRCTAEEENGSSENRNCGQCRPSKTSHLFLMYEANGEAILSNFPEVIVDSCSCSSTDPLGEPC